MVVSASHGNVRFGYTPPPAVGPMGMIDYTSPIAYELALHDEARRQIRNNTKPANFEEKCSNTAFDAAVISTFAAATGACVYFGGKIKKTFFRLKF